MADLHHLAESPEIPALAAETEFYPKYLCRNNALFIKLLSETKIQQIAGEDYGNVNWNWQSSSYECSALFTKQMLSDPNYIPVSEDAYNEIRNRYITFHKKLLQR
ncbi:hypothetical protein [Pontibacter sp. SGAir0037]|uniref:hypothetical protein n=1 Tax=Pontibacter sp. SGAir0037 TaxID=2571030 RepID=UPI0010CD4CAE|nr:hypothetical protein [Pontibacter sp. SGAir0037]QCR23093.1 hypothetical protein C1N53_12545 [Pontibacter sp. SGAir0037]